MIDISLIDKRLKLVIKAKSDKQKKFFRQQIKKIPGYEYDRSGDFYWVPLIELKSVVNILGNNRNFLDDKRMVLQKYNEAVTELKESLMEYNPSKFLDTLDTSKEYSFLKLPPKQFQKLAIEWGSVKKGSAQIYGGLIADEVGLGKTIESISIVCNLIEKGVCTSGIILCPANMGLQWKSEIEKFTDKTALVVSSRFQRKKEKRIEAYKNFKETFLIIGHELYKKDAADIQALKCFNENLNFSFIIVDEAHKMKNIQSDLYEKISYINPPVKLLLTATPIKKDVDDLYSLFNYLHPDILMGWNYFKNKFLVFAYKFGKEIPVGSRKEMEPFLHTLIAPYMIRRKSVDVSNEIPELVEIPVPLTPTSEQLRWFDILRSEMDKAMKDAEKAFKNNHIKIAELREKMYKSKFQALSVCSDHLALLNDMNSKQTQKLIEKHHIKDLTSPKLNWVIDFIESNLIQNNEFFGEEKEKVVIFTQFERMLGYLEKEIKNSFDKKYPNHLQIMRYTGKMDNGCARVSKDKLNINCFECSRAKECNSTEKSKFLFVNDPNVNVLLCTEAAQAGLNLQVARFLINYDLPYSPGSLDQRNGRIKRIGSKYSQVIIYNLFVEGGPDVNIVNRLESRRDSIDEIVESNIDEKEAYAKHIPKL